MQELANAKQDFLTGCYMREGLAPYLDKLIAEYKAYQKVFSMLLLDIDHFKPFNDKYGHLDGDQVLKYFASSLRLDLGQLDCQIFRFGGDEFIVVFPEKTPKEVRKIALTLRETLKSRPFLLSGRLFKMTFSGGIVSCVTDGDNMDHLFAHADKAMYISKKLGRDRAIIYSKIFLARAMYYSKLAGIAAVVVLAVMMMTGLVKGFSPKSFFRSLARAKPSISRKAKAAAKAVTTAPKLSTVYLKSGASFKGTILKENEKEVELNLVLDKGEGLVTLKKANIKKIDRVE
jgi:diguanylate cyclase (GGDEF)-like protein